MFDHDDDDEAELLYGPGSSVVVVPGVGDEYDDDEFEDDLEQPIDLDQDNFIDADMDGSDGYGPGLEGVEPVGDGADAYTDTYDYDDEYHDDGAYDDSFDGGGGGMLLGPDGNVLKVVIPKQDLPHARKVDRSNVEGWPDVEAQGEQQTMVALRVPPKVGGMYGRDAASTVDLEPLQDRHITLVYVGKQPPEERQRLHDCVRKWMTAGEWPPLEGQIQGWGTFTPPAKDDRNVLWMGWDIPGLAEFRHDLKHQLTRDGFDVKVDHDFVPHETVGYTSEPLGALPTFPERGVNHTFDGLLIGEGNDDWTEYPFHQGLVYASGRPAIVAALEAAVDDELAAMSDVEFDALIAAGGADRNRGNAEKLRRYWTVGKGGAKIRWNTKGDFKRCVRQLRKHLGPRANGYCALRHKEMTGTWTGDMAHRIKYGWGGKPGTYWAKVAAKNKAAAEGIAAGGEPQMVPLDSGSAGDVNPLLMMLPQPVTPQAFHIPLLLPEGVESGDGRTFEEGVVEVRDMPIPLLWQPNSMQGHDGAMIVGRIDSVDRVDGGIGNARGVFDTSPVALEAVRMIRDGFLRGVSADLDKFEAKIIAKGGTGTAPVAAEGKGDKKDDDDVVAPDKMKINKGRVMAATLVAKPAFGEVQIILDDDVTAVDATDDSEGEGEDMGEVAVPNEGAGAPLTASAGLADGVYRGALQEDLRTAAAKYAKREIQRVKYSKEMAEFSARSGLVASGEVLQIPVTPPNEWFTNPGLSKPTHLTITDDGRIFGHIAAWNVDHIGMGFGTRPPKSRTNYAYFRTGLLRTADGTDVRVGQITLTGGHASLNADARGAVKHYDDTQSAFADVAAGEDRHGIWVAGALRPEVTASQIRAARASSPSGDWRPINGKLELVAVCQVNVPGFPVVEARVASGFVVALVAAGTAPLIADLVSPVVAEAEAITEAAATSTVAAVEAELARPLTVREAAAVLATERLELQAAALRERFHAPPVALTADADVPAGLTIREAAAVLFAARGEALTAAARHALPDGSFRVADRDDLMRGVEEFGSCAVGDRDRVRRHLKSRARSLGAEDLLPIWWRDTPEVLSTDTPPEAVLAAGDTTVLSKQPVSTERRKTMAKKGEALPGGAYPIADVADLKRAIQSYGRAKESERKKVRDHISKRARALGHPELIPDAWKK